MAIVLTIIPLAPAALNGFISAVGSPSTKRVSTLILVKTHREFMYRVADSMRGNDDGGQLWAMLMQNLPLDREAYSGLLDNLRAASPQRS